MITFAKNNDSKEFIVCTEEGVNYRLREDNPDKKFYLLNQNQICHDMKFITLEKIYDVRHIITNL